MGLRRNVANTARRAACIDRAHDDKDEAVKICGQRLSSRRALCADLGEAPYNPKIDPANFVRKIDNPFLPFKPGTVLTYRADTEDGVERIVVTVTDKIERILGVDCVVVRDFVTLDGVVIEDTLDWYAQDQRGNVWYFGEISKTFENGDLVSLDGSWRGGVDGAKPGIVMLAEPRVGNVYRQEFALGTAEDYARVVSLKGRVSTPAASCADCLVTGHFATLDATLDERKYYKRGVGFIYEVDRKTGEKLELVSIKRP